jgi:hypothetical protein
MYKKEGILRGISPAVAGSNPTPGTMDEPIHIVTIDLFQRDRGGKRV